jgi:hypothetical protein
MRTCADRLLCSTLTTSPPRKADLAQTFQQTAKVEWVLPVAEARPVPWAWHLGRRTGNAQAARVLYSGRDRAGLSVARVRAYPRVALRSALSTAAASETGRLANSAKPTVR